MGEAARRISLEFQQLHPQLTKSEVRIQKRCDPATTPVARERAPRESEVIFVTGI
ncbi:hypothetical protein [Okeania sp. KiyG1]|uniref:hypothetical protein n=1 Tax=Okeania sp. KiyG1 TaxID=2720165 RepID=UPI001923B728|nr:hypothetical protein [Okeania sp. KiyG1]